MTIHSSHTRRDRSVFSLLQRRPGKRSRWIAATVLTVTSVLGLVAMTGMAQAGFTSGIAGNTGTYRSGAAILSDTVTGSTLCASSTTTVTTNNVNCAGDPFPSGTLPTTGTVSQKTTVTSGGTLFNSAAANLNTCGVQTAADTAGPDEALVHDTVTFGSAGPLGGTAAAFTQSSGAYLSTVTSYSQPQNFSISAWFNYPTGKDGTIIGFTDSSSDTGQANYDRHIWITSGRIYWGVYTTATNIVPTAGYAVSANTWHHVVAEIGSGGQSLYIDGTRVGYSATSTTAQTFTGYWHLGFGGEITGWANPPASAYWPGSLANVAIIPSQLTAAQVTNLYTRTTAAAEIAAVNALNPTNFWPLNDPGTGLYSGTVPDIPGSTFADATGNGDTGVGVGGVSGGSSGPLSANAASFDGASGYIQTATSFVDPHPLTVSAWFNTSVASGTVLEFGDTQAQGPTTWDRHIWIDSAGHLVWGVYPNAVQEITSPGTYADGHWHQVVASVGAAGMKLFVDGTLVASNATITVPQVFNGYWHIGWGNEQNGWTDPPTNPYWQGTIGHVAVYPTQLSNAQVATLASGTSTASLTAYEAAVMALGPTAYWPMTEPGSISGVCGLVKATVQAVTGATTTCLLPAGAGACATPSTTSLNDLSTINIPALSAPGVTSTVTVTLAHSAVTSFSSGLHVGGTFSFTGTGGGFEAWLNHSLTWITL